MHVVLSGYYGFDNVGDDAILLAIIEALKGKQADIKITALSNNPAATKSTFHVEAVNRNNLLDVIRVIRVSDGLISGGGSLLQNVTGMKSIPYYTLIMHIAKFFKKPIFVYAQGIGPINGDLSKRLVSHTLNKVDGITVRDEDSKRFLQNIGVKQEAQVVPDPVFGLESTLFESNFQVVNTPFIAVSVRNWKGYSYFKKQIASCLDMLAKDGYTIVFVPMHGEYDKNASLEIATMMDSTSEIISSKRSIKEKIAIIGESELLIGIRLHALIFSAITYTPFISISYDPKIDAFTSIFNETVAGNVAKTDWDAKTLYKRVNKKLLNRNALKESLLLKGTSLKKSANNTASRALEIFNK